MEDFFIHLLNSCDICNGSLFFSNREPVQIYAIDMDISERMGTLKARAAEALHLDLQNCNVTVLSEKEVKKKNQHHYVKHLPHFANNFIKARYMEVLNCVYFVHTLDI